MLFLSGDWSNFSFKNVQLSAFRDYDKIRAVYKIPSKGVLGDTVIEFVF